MNAQRERVDRLVQIYPEIADSKKYGLAARWLKDWNEKGYTDDDLECALKAAVERYAAQNINYISQVLATASRNRGRVATGATGTTQAQKNRQVGGDEERREQLREKFGQ